MPRNYFVYILSSRSNVLYVGVTNNLLHRLQQHRSLKFPGFTARYKVTRLVHCEETNDVVAAIEREKEIKGWRRSKKVALIEAGNPTWRDLADGWFEPRGIGDADVVAVVSFKLIHRLARQSKIRDPSGRSG